MTNKVTNKKTPDGEDPMYLFEAGQLFLFSQTEIAAIESDLLKHLSLTSFPQMCLEYS